MVNFETHINRNFRPRGKTDDWQLLGVDDSQRFDETI
jgi:hypothetical protein